MRPVVTALVDSERLQNDVPYTGLSSISRLIWQFQEYCFTKQNQKLYMYVLKCNSNKQKHKISGLA